VPKVVADGLETLQRGFAHVEVIAGTAKDRRVAVRT
jgi:hypothetical protein